MLKDLSLELQPCCWATDRGTGGQSISRASLWASQSDTPTRAGGGGTASSSTGSGWRPAALLLLHRVASPAAAASHPTVNQIQGDHLMVAGSFPSYKPSPDPLPPKQPSVVLDALVDDDFVGPQLSITVPRTGDSAAVGEVLHISAGARGVQTMDQV